MKKKKKKIILAAKLGKDKVPCSPISNIMTSLAYIERRKRNRNREKERARERESGLLQRKEGQTVPQNHISPRKQGCCCCCWQLVANADGRQSFRVNYQFWVYHITKLACINTDTRRKSENEKANCLFAVWHFVFGHLSVSFSQSATVIATAKLITHSFICLPCHQ